MRSRARFPLLHSMANPSRHVQRLTSYSVGAHFIYGSWYKHSELGTRAAIFCGFGNLGNMAGGWIQAALLQSLSGRSSSLAAWRLIFIVVACTTIPFAVFGKVPSVRADQR